MQTIRWLFTLPERVAQRMYEAFKQHDLDAMYATFDSVFDADG